MEYLEEPVKDYVQAVVDSIVDIDKREGPGTIVAVLPDMKDCSRVINQLNYQLQLHLVTDNDLHPTQVKL